MSEATKVILHGPLGDMFGRERLLHVSSPAEAIRALCALCAGFREELSRPGACYSVLAGDDALPVEGLRLGTGGRGIHIVPAVAGAKSDGATVLIGAALLAASYAFGPAGSGALFAGKLAGAAGAALAGVGFNLALGGVVSLISPTARQDGPAEQPQNRPSALFAGPVNTIAQDHPIQICYGEVEIGSALISTMIDHDDRPRPAGGAVRGGGSGVERRWLDRRPLAPPYAWRDE